MVATRGQGTKRPAEQEQEPPKTDYERRRDTRVANNLKKMQEFSLKNLSTEFNNSVSQSASKKEEKSANKKTNSEDSNSSEYLLEDDDQGDSDDDDTESDGQPQPLATKYPPGYSRKVLASKKKKIGPTMAPGVRASKRVRASQGSQVQTPESQTRSSKRLQPSARDGQNGQDNTAAEEVSGAGAQDSTGADEENVVGEEDTEAPAQRAPRRPRPPTKGTQLDRMTKAMGRRMPIAIAEGKRRPHEPVQAAKFASEAGVIIQDKESSEKNKKNRRKVKYHQATGSHSYVAHLHAYKKKKNNAEPSTEQNGELDAVEAFKTCHTSSKHSLTELAREAVSVGIKPVPSSKSSSSNESELREQLAAEATAAVQGEIDELRKRSEEAEEKIARTQKEMEEYKKLTEINNKLLVIPVIFAFCNEISMCTFDELSDVSVMIW
ncbi:uncharacterized protein [Miscanthus floridulus]|uniref:uncharacterized protein n=1 Tax=Miscanthus floridulus TaxID=154761 RepID=UPI003459712C